MAVYYARATGNVNGAIWATTPTGTASNLFSSFTNADTLMANSFTVTLNVNTTVLEIRNDSANGATASGSFTLNDGITLTANVVCGGTSNNCVTYAGNASASIVGAVSSEGNNRYGVAITGAGTLNITGSVSGGSISLSHGVGFTSTGTCNITGNVFGGSGAAAGILQTSGNGGKVTVTGNVIGGGLVNAPGINANSASGVYTVIGTAIGGSAGPGIIVSTGAGPVTVTRAKGNGFGNGSVGLSAAVGVASAQSSPARISEIEYGDLGQSPTSGPIILTDATSNVALVYRTSGGKKTLVDSAATADYPANSNVRNGTVFANGNRTGTMVVPPASSVVAGAAVDNTVGTAVLNSSAAQTAFDAALSGFSSGRLGNCATVASTGQQLANALTE